MNKIKQTEEFSTKEFNVYFPFEQKSVACPDCGSSPCTCEEETGKILKITGYANFSGNLEDEASIFVDHSGDVMVPSGFDLKTWNKNPQILWQHDRNYTIGKGLKAVKKADGLEITAEIHEKAMEEEDFYKVEKGLVTMLSVGFRTLAGEYKEINKQNVFFITKALLYEVSVVAIPCNSESGFSIVKSLGDGSFSAEDFTPKSTSPTVDAIYKNEDGDNYMKVKLRDKLSSEKVKELEDLGFGATLEESTEVDTKSYIDEQISKGIEVAVAAAIETIKAELTKAAEVVVEVTSEETEVTADETKTDEEAIVEEVKEIEEEAFKSITDGLDKIKALYAE